jgi:hypothetical protein
MRGGKGRIKKAGDKIRRKGERVGERRNKKEGMIRKRGMTGGGRERKE